MKTSATFDNLAIALSCVLLYICTLYDAGGHRFPEVVHHRGSVGPSVLWDYYTTGDVSVVSIVWDTNQFIQPSFSFSTQTLHSYRPSPNPHEPRW